jgi:hypothetical protein
MSGAVLTRSVATAQAGWGAALLIRPQELLRRLAPGSPLPPAWIVRLLGARSVVQAGTVLLRPTRGVVLAGAAVDGLHAASMIGLAVRSPSHRRPALVSAAVAVGSAVAGVATAPRPDDRRTRDRSPVQLRLVRGGAGQSPAGPPRVGGRLDPPPPG